MYRAYCINSVTLGETRQDVSITQGTHRIKDKKNVNDDSLDGAIPYVQYDPYRRV